MSFLTRDEIVKQTWPVVEVDLPDFAGRKVRVKTLSAAEFLRLVELEKQHPKQAYALWWVLSVCDTDGKAIFAETDIDVIAGIPFGSVMAVVDAARKLNRIPTEQAEGNSDPTPSGD